MTDGAEQNGVGGPQQIQRVLRRHAAVREIILRAPVEVLEAAGEVVLSSRAIENLLRRWNDFLANAVAGDYCYIQFAQPTKLTCFGLGIEAFEFEGASGVGVSQQVHMRAANVHHDDDIKC